LCGKHAIGPDHEALMRQVEADTVVCLTQEHELADRYPDYVRWLRAAPPDRLVWYPIHDLHAPSLDEFAPVLADIVGRLTAGRSVILHCAAGIGRAGTTAVAVLVSMGLALDAAIDQVRRHRPGGGPEAGSQLELVRRLHEQLTADEAVAMDDRLYDDPIRLYDGPAPGSESWTNTERRYHSELWDTEVVTNVAVPTIVPVRPAPGHAGPSGAAVIVAPGGGFHALSIASEGFEVAERLAAEGITAFVLQYRLVPGGEDPVAELSEKMLAGDTSVFADMAAVAPLAGADGAAAMRLVRARADDVGIDPQRVGFMGFSAGGNVAVRVAYASDPAVRPDFVAAIYPSTRGIELTEPPAGSGPLFLTVATDDDLGLTDDSIELYEQWRGAKLPVELHAYARGGHGFGMRANGVPSDTWIDRFVDWFASTTRVQTV
jgi:acetyl esterase/lipase